MLNQCMEVIRCMSPHAVLGHSATLTKWRQAKHTVLIVVEI